MEAKNILLVGVWAFTIIWLVGIMQARGDLLSALMVFVVAIIVSIGAIAFQKGADSAAVTRPT